MSRDLRHRVLVITGASSGIGAATAVEAGRAGMRVVLAARRQSRLEEVADQVRRAGGEARVVPTDVADTPQIDALFDQAVDHFGGVDALFANAGYGWFAPTTHDLGETESHLWQVNYFGAVHALRRAADLMQRQGHGHLLVCSSIVARSGLPYSGTYAATKAALHAMTVSMQLELAPDGIDVSCVYPGATDTEFHARVRSKCGRDPTTGDTPRMFVTSPRGVARRVVRCLRRPRPEVWPSRLDHAAAVLWSAFPRFRTFCFRFQADKARRAWQQVRDTSRHETLSATEEARTPPGK